MNKKDLLEALRGAMTTENTSVLCIRNVVGTFAWSGLPEQRRREIADSLNAIAQPPQQRAERIQRMIDQMEGSDKDVF